MQIYMDLNYTTDKIFISSSTLLMTNWIDVFITDEKKNVKLRGQKK